MRASNVVNRDDAAIGAASGRRSALERPSRDGSLLLTLAVLLAIALGSRGITNEGAVSLQGDMPRHLMNGVLLLDFLSTPASWTISGGLEYAKEYFARYPALSLGHHPPLLPLSLVPFYALFGVSVFAGRLAILSFFVMSVVLIYLVARQRFDGRAAGWASVLFASNPFLLVFGQTVLSEMPMIAMVLCAMYWLGRFRDFGQLRDFGIFVVAAGASLLAKQLAVFMAPFYVAMLAASGAWPLLLRRKLLIWAVPAAAALAGVGIATVLLAPFNVEVVLRVMRQGISWPQVVATILPIWNEQLSPSLGVTALIGLAVGIARRERRTLQFALWIVAVTSGVIVITGAVESPRYSIVAFPAYCILAASLASGPNRRAPILMTVLLAVNLGLQLGRAVGVVPVGAAGYEQAARRVVAGTRAPTVLYSASVDTGYFVFFVRKHDPAQRLAILRSDKLLTTSQMDRVSVEDRIERPEDMYPLLRMYGTRYIVIEDRASESKVLEWLRSELLTPRFAERERIPIETIDRRLAGQSLVVYEFLEAGPADPNAELDMNLPIVGRSIRVKLSDVVSNDGP